MGIWRNRDQLRDPELKRNAATLPKLITSAWAESTSAKYARGWQGWLHWATNYTEIAVMPADPFHVAMYYNDMVCLGASTSAITSAHMGIRQMHIIAGLAPPTNHPFLKAAYEGAKRLSAPNTNRNKKEPMTAGIIKQIVEAYRHTEDLIKIRFVITCLMSFAGFLRSDDLRRIQVKNISFYDDHLTVFLPKAKNDQSRKGNLVHIAKLDSTYCPVECTRKFIAQAQLQGEDYLISTLRKTKNGHRADGRKPLSYTRLRDDFHQHLKPILSLPSTEPGNISLHSMRSGGASEAAAQNVSDRLIKKHGRWRSDSSRDLYIKDTKHNRLTITRRLGI